MKIQSIKDKLLKSPLFADESIEKDVDKRNEISELSPNNDVKLLVGDDQKEHNDSSDQSDRKTKCWEICAYLLEYCLYALCFLLVCLYVVIFFSNVLKLQCRFFSKDYSESEMALEAVKYVFGTFSLLTLVIFIFWIVFAEKNKRKLSHFVYFTICNGLFYFVCFWLQYSKTFDFCSYFK